MSERPPRPLGASVHRQLVLRLGLSAVALALLLGVVSQRLFRAEFESGLLERIQTAGTLLADQLEDDMPLDRPLTTTEFLELLRGQPSWQALSSPSGHALDLTVFRADQSVLYTFTDDQTLSAAEFRRAEAAWDSLLTKEPDRAARWLSLPEGLLALIVEPIIDDLGQRLGRVELVFWVEPGEVEGFRRSARQGALTVAGIALLTALLIYPIVLQLLRRLSRLSERLLDSHFEALGVLGGAIAKRDSDTSEHNFRVTLYALRLAEAMGQSAPFRRRLFKGAFLHDVGKIAIPDGILLKPGRLTDEEFAQMKTHVTHGVDILERSGWLGEGIDVVRHHHEKYDGSGYTGGLTGQAIPLAARIFAVVDVFDALTSRRPYKEPMPFDRAMKIIREGRGTHFDPKVVDAFETIAEQLHRDVGGLDESGLRKAIIHESRELFSTAEVEASEG